IGNSVRGRLRVDLRSSAVVKTTQRNMRAKNASNQRSSEVFGPPAAPPSATIARKEREPMRRARVLPAIVLAALTALIACTKGNECDKCTTDADCKEGFFCTDFNDQSR